MEREISWEKVKKRVQEQFKKEPDVKSVLFVIGIRELGQGKKTYSKEEKTDLMNLAFCRVASHSGYFKMTSVDKKGWPVWEQQKPLPKMNAREQEAFIIDHLIIYFEEEGLIA